MQRTGLEVLRIVQEPVAAGIAYGIGQGESKPQRIAVYSLGGGSFEFTLLSLRGSSPGSAGSRRRPGAGGEDFDRRILDWLIFGFARIKIDLRQDRTALQRVRDAVEKPSASCRRWTRSASRCRSSSRAARASRCTSCGPCRAASWKS